MSQFKFACSHCGQRLECDEQFSGRQIPCPSCKALTLVPPVPAKTPPPPPQKSGMTFVPESWRPPHRQDRNRRILDLVDESDGQSLLPNPTAPFAHKSNIICF
jgi:hypothetical protein